MNENDAILELSQNLDRLTRLLHVGTRPGAKDVDTDRIGPFGAMILQTIADFEPIAIQKLAESLGRDKAQMTRAVQLLERHALIERMQSADDGRVSLVRLTQKGRDLASAFNALVAEEVKKLFSDLDDAELTEFANLLKKVVFSQGQKRGFTVCK